MRNSQLSPLLLAGSLAAFLLAGTPTSTGAETLLPPRKVNDILEIINKYKNQTDPEVGNRAAALQLVKSPPPETSDDAALSDFYYKRGNAAESVGELRQANSDFVLSKNYAQRSSAVNKTRYIYIIQKLAYSWIAVGSYRQFIDGLNELINLSDNKVGYGRGFLAQASLAIELLSLGEVERAKVMLADAVEKFNSASIVNSIGWKNFQNNWITNMSRQQGEYSLFSGNYLEAEKYANISVEHANGWVGDDESMGFRKKNFISALRLLSRVHAAQGNLLEAEVEARHALLASLREYSYRSPISAVSLKNLANITAQKSAGNEASRLYEEAIKIYTEIGASPSSLAIVGSRSQLASHFTSLLRWEEANAEFEKISSQVNADPALNDLYLSRNKDFSLTLAKQGQWDKAEVIAKRLLASNIQIYGEKNYFSARARGLLGIVTAGKGDLQEAKKLFQASIPEVVDEVKRLGGENFRANMWARVIVEGYLDVLYRLNENAVSLQVFTAVEGTRSTLIQRAIVANAARSNSGAPELAELARQEQDLSQQIAAYQALVGGLAQLSEDDQKEVNPKELTRKLEESKEAQKTVHTQIAKRFPSYSQLLSPSPPTIEHTQKELRTGETLILFFAGDRRSSVWAVPETGAPAYAIIDAGSAELSKLVTSVRKSVEFQGDSVGSIPAFDMASADKLYKLLLEPVKDGWKDAKSLIIVP
ncbi:MAG: tetratricopeptide repeat protein, partial [Alphaproteobacteria bacterium]|nr:tetratricopeptide repeat protein [Alphaproteobacteria bacterium]